MPLTHTQSTWNGRARLTRVVSASGPLNWRRHATISTVKRSFIGEFGILTFSELIFVMNSDRQMISTCSDIKPDNILLDAHGHVHLTDFNVAIHYSERRLHTSVAGSMAYMAPEILARALFTIYLVAVVLIASFGRTFPSCRQRLHMARGLLESWRLRLRTPLRPKTL